MGGNGFLLLEAELALRNHIICVIPDILSVRNVSRVCNIWKRLKDLGHLQQEDLTC